MKHIYSMILPALSGFFNLYSGGGSGGGNTTSTTTMAPSKEVAPYLKPYMDQAGAISSTPYSPYQGQQIADINGQQQMGMGMTSAQALNGFQGQSEAGQNYQDLMGGKFLDPNSNPWLAANAQKAMGDISNAYKTGTMPQTDSAASRAGAFGGSAWQQMVGNNERQLGDSLGNAANQFYGQNYANERSNQMHGLDIAGQMQNLGYTDSKNLTAVGDNYRQYQQDLLNQSQNNYNDYMNYPQKQLDIMGNAIRATMGAGSSSSSSQSNPYKPSGFANALGGGIGGYALGNAIGGYGAAGAGLGALGGLLL